MTANPGEFPTGPSGDGSRRTGKGLRGRAPPAGRLQAEERLESPGVPPADLRRSLRAMTAVNLRLGGMRSLLSHLVPLARGRDRLSLLDIGTGSGELPAALARKLERQGTRVWWLGLDRHPAILREAAVLAPNDGSAVLIRADAGKLPLARRSVDVVTSSLFLHHLDTDEAIAALGEMARVARLAVLVSDLERHPVHYLGARLLAATLWRRDPITRHDGPISVLRSYTPDELREVGSRAGFSSFSIRRHFPFRLVLEGRP